MNDTDQNSPEGILPFLISNDATDDPNKLRERMRRDGYLFFRGLISAADIRRTRAEILALCAGAGWLAPGTEPNEGIAAPGIASTEPQPDYMAVYNPLLRGEAFNALAHDSGLLNVLEGLFGEAPLPHARNIARIIFPQNTLHTTPSHQDYLHIQGTEETYTAWIPLGDCPRSLGSLVVMPGSHHSGVYSVQKAHGAGGVGIDTDALPFPWAGGDFAEGDALLFNSLTIHKALPNLTPDRLRLSVDFRYQPLSHPIAPSSLEPHHQQQTWEEIYADWKSDLFKYYWRDLPLTYAGSDPRVTAVREAALSSPRTEGETT